jgi:hypothetical protein
LPQLYPAFSVGHEVFGVLLLEVQQGGDVLADLLRAFAHGAEIRARVFARLLP